MKKITLTADEALLKRAQAKARAEKTTLTTEFRRWLEEYTAEPDTSTAEQGGWLNRAEKKQTAKQTKSKSQSKPQPEKPGITLAGCVDAFKKFEKKLEEKL